MFSNVHDKGLSRFLYLQVTGVVGRAEILSSIFYLAALMTYAKCTGPKAKTGRASFSFDINSLRR